MARTLVLRVSWGRNMQTCLHTLFGLHHVFQHFHTRSFRLRVKHDSHTMKSLSLSVLATVQNLSACFSSLACLSLALSFWFYYSLRRLRSTFWPSYQFWLSLFCPATFNKRGHTHACTHTHVQSAAVVCREGAGVKIEQVSLRMIG